MSRTTKDPYASIRREIPPPGYAIGSSKYVRVGDNNIIEEGIVDWEEDTTASYLEKEKENGRED